MSASASAVLSLVVHWLSLWLGLYLVSRRPRTAVSLLAGAAIICMSSYLLCTALLFDAATRAEAVFWAKALGGWSCFAPVLLLHAIVRLADWRSPLQRALLLGAYGLAVVAALLGLSDTLAYDYWGPSPAAAGEHGGFLVGPFYPLLSVELVVPLLIAVLVLVRARPAERARSRGAGRQLDVLLAGTVVMLAASCLLLANALADGPLPESLLQPFLLIGAGLVVVPLVGYRGLPEGQLLRRDLMASLLGSLLLMTGFSILIEVAHEPLLVAALLGWFVLTVFVFADELRGLADYAVFGAGARAGRAGLRTAASYAGSLDALDLTSLPPQQYATLLHLLGQVDRAGIASTRLGGARDPRLVLLADEEFAAVRTALGLPPEWRHGDEIPRGRVRARVASLLRPRERQALGLKYLGYSDKQMAELMGVREGVPRSYIGDGKRKLGLSAGTGLLLFVHFSGIVEEDTLTLLAPAQRQAASPDQATGDRSSEPAAERPDMATRGY